MKHLDLSIRRFAALLAVGSILVSDAASQASVPTQAELQAASASSDAWWFAMFVFFACGIALAIFLWRKSKKGAAPYENENRYANYYSDSADDGSEDVDADKEMEWLRKVKKPQARIPKLRFDIKKSEVDAKKAKAAEDAAKIDTKAFQEKMRKMQYAQLPINSFTQLAPAKRYTPLPTSDDEQLLNAIEQASDEYEEDEAVREIALRVLAAFKAHNAVDAVAQIALYDLSSNLRSKAVSMLAEFDHESVFETILLACADPTREVRAAAARGLFRLSFDRAHAWKRLIEADDDYRLTQASRAAIESGFVEKSVERLIHDDVKVAYEAFALCSMLIKAGEASVLFETLKNHSDLRVKFALLHVLSVQKDQRVLPELYKFVGLKSLSPEVLERARDTISAYEEVIAWNK